MDDRTFWLVAAVLGASTLIVLAAGIGHFDVPAGFWAIPGGIVTLITVISARNGNGKAKPPPVDDSTLSDAEFTINTGTAAMSSDHKLLAKVALLCGLTVIGSGGAAAVAQNFASDASDQAASASAFAEQIRDSLLDSCAQGNRLRVGLRADKHQDIRDTRRADPADFPDIPIARSSPRC